MMTTSILLFARSLADELSLCDRYETAHSYLSSVNRIVDFTGNDKLSFQDLTPALLKAFENHLQNTECKRNTSSLYMRMLRSIYRQAEEQAFATPNNKLFKHVFTGCDPSPKRATSPEVIRLIQTVKLEANHRLSFARDMFILSFYLRGIPFVDLAHLRKSDINNGVLYYRRSKTGQLLTIKIEKCAKEIIERYEVQDSSFLLPIIKNPGENEHRQYQSALRLYNKHLHELSDLLGLKVHLTSYVARHSWATIAYHEGVAVSLISASLSHTSEKVTYRYLKSFEADTLADINQYVIALIGGDKHHIEEKKSKKRKKNTRNKAVPFLRR